MELKIETDLKEDLKNLSQYETYLFILGLLKNINMDSSDIITCMVPDIESMKNYTEEVSNTQKNIDLRGLNELYKSISYMLSKDIYSSNEDSKSRSLNILVNIIHYKNSSAKVDNMISKYSKINS